MIKARLALECDSEQQDGVQYWPMLTPEAELIGVCGLHKQNAGVYELGYHLQPKFWHQGLATESPE